MPDSRRMPRPPRRSLHRPKRKTLPLPARFTRAVDALAKDRRSGSVPLALRACDLLAHCQAMATDASGNFFPEAAQAVAQAQPSMAAVWNACDHWLRQVERGTPPQSAARRVAQELSRAQNGAAAHAAKLIRNQCAVATYSSSSTVEAALLMARRKGKQFRVLCSEGRPMFEGRDMAQRLAANGIPVEIFTDAALLASLPGADVVLIGCDAVFPDGFVNKVGTHALLRMAQLARIPAYVVADSFKLLPAEAARSILVREEDAGKVWKPSIKNLRVRNYYFEKVPRSACSGMITERGLEPAGWRHRFGGFTSRTR
ncbi:MAG: hypothetical protein HY316_04300 [Acidobacteria bacterium]|nr:hypothetical protein [Acidobacteriota bacterium]